MACTIKTALCPSGLDVQETQEFSSRKWAELEGKVWKAHFCACRMNFTVTKGLDIGLSISKIKEEFSPKKMMRYED